MAKKIGKKLVKKWLLVFVFSRFIITIFLMLLQIYVAVYISTSIVAKYSALYTLSNILIAGVIIKIINVDLEPTAKLIWFFLIAVAPVFAAFFYLYSTHNLANIRTKARFRNLEKERKSILTIDEYTQAHCSTKDVSLARLAEYLYRTEEFPIYDKTNTVYFSNEEEKFKATLESLRKAERFIFIETFIIDKGEMWDEVLEILKEKAKQGVLVRLMYDGTCEFFRLPKSYPKILESYGIECRVFSKIIPLFSTQYNYRDHRKILVIDNKAAFTGGSNFADEYINIKERFGHWKDSGVLLYGDAVKTYTLSFLEMWAIEEKQYNPNSFIKFRHEAVKYTSYDDDYKRTSDFVLPFTDNPLDMKRTGERVYLYLFYTAKNFLHICTPYLILDYEMEESLRFAAERGVDVKIVLPAIPDKKIVYSIAYTHYKNLLTSGVKIYHYTPGFIHQKTAVMDGSAAVLGTINLDYRSLYHHFENGVLLYGTELVAPMEKDFEEIIELSKEITLVNMKEEVQLYRKILGPLNKIVAPLL